MFQFGPSSCQVADAELVPPSPPSSMMIASLSSWRASVVQLREMPIRLVARCIDISCAVPRFSLYCRVLPSVNCSWPRLRARQHKQEKFQLPSRLHRAIEPTS